MNTSLPILAQPLAPDCIGLAILLFVVLALLHGLGPHRNRLAASRSGSHHLYGMGQRLHELISHRHH